MTWTMLLFLHTAPMVGAGNLVVLSDQPIVLGGYASEEACNEALAVSIKKFKTAWRAAYGNCVPGGNQ